jgi:hypothetical protein
VSLSLRDLGTKGRAATSGEVGCGPAGAPEATSGANEQLQRDHPEAYGPDGMVTDPENYHTVVLHWIDPDKILN